MNISTKKLFLEKKININYKYFITNDILQFDNGNFLIGNLFNIQIYNSNFKMIYKEPFSIYNACIIDNTSFFVVNIKGIYLFSQNQNKIKNNKDQESINLKVNDFSHEMIYEYTKYWDKRKLIYNKKNHKLLLLYEREMFLFKFYPNNHNLKLELITRIKINEYITFTLFRNNYLIFKKKDNDNKLILYDCRNMKEIKSNFEIKINKLYFSLFFNKYVDYFLKNYNEKYFIFVDYDSMQFFDFDKRQLVLSYKIVNFPKYINITKNYILIHSNIILDIYDKKKLSFIESKSFCCCDDGSNPAFEIENNKIVVFKGEEALIYSQNNKCKIYLFSFIRILYIFLALCFLIYTILIKKYKVVYIIINLLNICVVYSLIFLYNSIELSPFLISTYF